MNKSGTMRDFTILPGLDFSGVTGLDSLTLQPVYWVHTTGSRNVYDFRFPVGFFGEIKA